MAYGAERRQALPNERMQLTWLPGPQSGRFRFTDTPAG